LKGFVTSEHFGGLAPGGGQCTDDTACAILLHTSLQEKRKLDPDDVAAKYRGWRMVTFDIGGQTSGALKESSEHGGALGGLIHWSKGSFKGAGNGSLMRTYPIPVLYVNNEVSDVIITSILESAITHADPRCAMACAVYNAAIHTLLNGKTPQEAHAIALASLSYAREQTYAQLWNVIDKAKIPYAHILKTQEALGKGSKLAFVDLAADLAEAAAPNPNLYGEVEDSFGICGKSSDGFVRVAFRAAFWSLLHATDFESGVLNVANRGGDSDTTSAIAGAMLGARFGLKGIPPEWVDRVLNVDCTTAKGVQASNPIFNGALHPRRFIEIGV
jgi:ADP-ribosylglycohydrolase